MGWRGWPLRWSGWQELLVGEGRGRPTAVSGEWRGALMVCGTSSDAGKSTVVAGLCRLLARRGIRVAPFKAQNMSLNSAVTASGHEIGRAQAAQAEAAGIEAEVAMNPVLLKPTSDRASQVVVLGRPRHTLDAAAYHARKDELFDVVSASLADLRGRFDVVVCEGAGSPAEINLLDRDIVNLRLARRAGIPAVVVGDIDRGGVFASLYGTVAVLPDDLRAQVRGFIINKFRGDPALLGGATADLAARCGVPTLGVVPWTPGAAIDAEDSLALRGGFPAPLAELPPHADVLDVAVVRFPRLSNFTDLDPLALEPGVRLRWVEHGSGLGHPDLLILPGSKATVADLAWLRQCGLDRAVIDLAGRQRTTIIGVCAGYQMLGQVIHDQVESRTDGPVVGLGLLDTVTTFGEDKVTRRRHGEALGQALTGYQIHHGRTLSHRPWMRLATEDGGQEDEGSSGGAVLGTSVHGLWESDRFRQEFLAMVGHRAAKRVVPAGVDFGAARRAGHDRLADLLEAHLDLAALEAIMSEAASPG
jgi:adenosylcobyric acid synthase